MERKTVKFEVKDIDEEQGVFTGYAATFSKVPDSYGDVIESGAFSKTIQEGASRIKILWNHNVDEPIGKPLEITEDERGLLVKGKLSLGVQRAREVLALMKDGVINEMSIGYETVKSDVLTGVRHLKELRLWDTSPVTFAANPEAQITSVKAIEELKADVERLKALLPPEAVNDTSEGEAADIEQALAELQATADGFDARVAESRIEEILATL